MRTPTEMNEHLLPLELLLETAALGRRGWARTPTEMNKHLQLLKALVPGYGKDCSFLFGNSPLR